MISKSPAYKDSKKRSYKNPKLTVFGSIKDLTLQHAGGPSNDKGTNMMGS